MLGKAFDCLCNKVSRQANWREPVAPMSKLKGDACLVHSQIGSCQFRSWPCLKSYVNYMEHFPCWYAQKIILNQRIVIRKSNWLEAKPVGNLYSVDMVELISWPPTEENSSQWWKRDLKPPEMSANSMSQPPNGASFQCAITHNLRCYLSFRWWL